MKTVAIIGAGITGLTAAYSLKKKGFDVQVLEVSHKPGGVIQTIHKNGFTMELGPNAIMGLRQNLVQLFEEIGLDDEAIEASPTARKRFIVRNGQLHALPQSFFQFLTTPLLSLNAKLSILKEPFAPSSTNDEETLEDFIKRRFNNEILYYGFEPFLSGIYAGASNKLSLKHAMPKLYELERSHGSLLKAALHLIKERRRTGAAFKGQMISFKSGMHALPAALARTLDQNIRYNSHLQSIRLSEGGWQLTWASTGEGFTGTFDNLLLATPAHTLSRLPFNMDVHAYLSPLSHVPYAPLSVINFGLHRNQIKHSLDGVGFLTSSQEKHGTLGVLFNSSAFPFRAPSDHVMLTAFIGGCGHPKRAAMPASDLQSIAYYDLQNLLGVTGEPIVAQHTYWPYSVPQYNIGHERFLSMAETAERTWPRLFIGGNFRTGVSVTKCLQAGLDLAERIATHNQ